MTGFRALLEESGLSKAGLARHLRLHVNTVSAWGDNPPGYALAYLELYVSMQRNAQEQIQLLARLSHDGS